MTIDPRNFVLPVNKNQNRQTSPWGVMRTITAKGTTTRRPHKGLDLAPTMNVNSQSVMATYQGTIAYAGQSTQFGNVIVVYHGVNPSGKNVYSVYAHLASFSSGIARGQAVSTGQPIGILGNTGRSTGPHLHFEILESDKPLKFNTANNPTSLGLVTGIYSVNPFDPDPNRTDDIPYLDSSKRPKNGSGGTGGTEMTDNDPTSGEVLEVAAYLSGNAPEWLSSLAGIVGNSLSAYLFKGNILAQITGSALINAIGTNVVQAIAQGGIKADVAALLSDGTVGTVKRNILDDFGSDLANSFQSAAIGAFSSFLSLEVGNALGLSGFGGELITTGASSVLGQVLNNASAIAQGGSASASISGNLFHGLSRQGLFGNAVDPANLAKWNAGLVSSAVGGFLGAKLGSLILSPTNTEGAILSSIGSAAGAWAFGTGAAAAGSIGSIGASISAAVSTISSTLGNIAAPFVGSLVGFLLGSLIGRLFGRKKPRIPSASADIELSLTSGFWSLTSVQAANNGNRGLVVSMAEVARDSINGVVSEIVGGRDIANVGNSVALSQRYGHSGSTIFMDEKVGSSWVRRYSGSDATVAVTVGSLAGIRATRVSGGDLILKRAIYGSQAADMAALLGDIISGADYGRYLEDRETINALMVAAPNSAFTATWTAALGKAADLGLQNYRSSDFFGGLGGFAASFGYGSDATDGLTGHGYEHLAVAFEGAALRVSATDGHSPFDLLRSTNNLTGAQASQSALIANFGANVGYTPWGGQATAGNDIWIASAGGAVTMDDSGYVEEWRWNPWDYSYEPYYTYVTGGDDIFVGSAYADSLYGRAGWDWLDGGAGDDLIDGGDNDDVLLGRAGNDRMLGGSGNDYLAGGEGDDYFFDANRTWGLYGGDGNDVLVGGEGMDALYGENGDDVFIVDQDGGGTWDALTGQSGSDTLSYERFTSGVYIDFATLGGWSWDPTAKYIYGDAVAGSMENVTGSQHDDIIYGDTGNNVLRGLDGDDLLVGRDGDDTLEGGAGADQLQGGSGSDTASYRFSAGAVQVALDGSILGGSDAEGDSFVSIENLSGSSLDDVLSGDAGDNHLSGVQGNDDFILTAGSDFVDGGEGFDLIKAGINSSAMNIYYDEGYYDPYYGYFTPGAGWIASTSNGTTSFTSIEGFVGSAYADSISGSGADELFEGGAGNDYLVGAGGSDTFVFGRGDGQDTVYSSSAGSSTIALKEGINWRDVLVVGANYSQQYGNLTVAIRGTSDQITVSSNFYYVNSGNTAGQHTHAIKTLNLGGGSTVDIDMIDWTPDAAYEWGTTVYGAQNRSDLIFAYGGDDTIYTAGGGYESRDNVVYAGDGNDTIFASVGDDQYIFERGNGVDTLYDDGGADTIVMGPSVAADEVIYEVVPNGNSADLYIGVRDANNPNATASQVADRIRVVGGGMKMIGMYYGNERLNTVEFVRVGGQEIDLTKANINWAIGYEDDGYYGGGDGGGGGGGGYNIPPLAIDLDGDGIELRSVEGSRIASIDADGKVTRMGWLGQDDGFLALDRDGNGVIDRIGEISFASDVKGARTDLEGLAAYDSNGDGKLDASDKRWGEFKVWQDKNQDGFGSKDELVTLDKAGITYINLKGTLTGFTGAGVDGFDNTVVATTEIGWADKTRTGQGYDVLLARLQVRTDGGVKDSVLTDALARVGIKADSVEALLHGNQALTEEQAKALREQKAKGSQVLGEGGLLYRIEDLVGSSAKLIGGAAAKTVNGLMTIDPSVAQKVVAASRALGIIDRFAGSDWTKLGSIALGKADARLAATVTKRDLAAELKGVIKDARKIVAERKLADEAKAAATAAKDAADSVLRPITPPTAAELERLKQLDKFRLLEGADDDLAAAEDDDVLDALADELMRQNGASADTPMVQDAPVDQQTEEVAAADTSVTAEPVAAAESADAPARSTAGDDLVSNDNAATDVDAYGVVIRTANARLVQALASFGDAPAMMASYQGLNVANDAQAAWLSVDAMPSVQRLAAIR